MSLPYRDKAAAPAAAWLRYATPVGCMLHDCLIVAFSSCLRPSRRHITRASKCSTHAGRLLPRCRRPSGHGSDAIWRTHRRPGSSILSRWPALYSGWCRHILDAAQFSLDQDSSARSNRTLSNDLIESDHVAPHVKSIHRQTALDALDSTRARLSAQAVGLQKLLLALSMIYCHDYDAIVLYNDMQRKECYALACREASRIRSPYLQSRKGIGTPIRKESPARRELPPPRPSLSNCDTDGSV